METLGSCHRAINAKSQMRNCPNAIIDLFLPLSLCSHCLTSPILQNSLSLLSLPFNSSLQKTNILTANLCFPLNVTRYRIGFQKCILP